MAFVSNYGSKFQNNLPDDDVFIDLIKSRPCLFDKTNKFYQNKLVKSNAWKELGSVLNVEGDFFSKLIIFQNFEFFKIFLNIVAKECESHWENLKNKYNRETLLREKETRSGSAKCTRTPWPLYESMRSMFEKVNNSRKYNMNYFGFIYNFFNTIQRVIFFKNLLGL